MSQGQRVPCTWHVLTTSEAQRAASKARLDRWQAVGPQVGRVKRASWGLQWRGLGMQRHGLGDPAARVGAAAMRAGAAVVRAGTVAVQKQGVMAGALGAATTAWARWQRARRGGGDE